MYILHKRPREPYLEEGNSVILMFTFDIILALKSVENHLNS